MQLHCLYHKYYKQSPDGRIKYVLGNWFMSFHFDMDDLQKRIERIKLGDSCLDGNSAVIKSIDCPFTPHVGECEAWIARRYRATATGTEIDCDVCSNIRKFSENFPQSPE
jgi:hypothetical protein